MIVSMIGIEANQYRTFSLSISFLTWSIISLLIEEPCNIFIRLNIGCPSISLAIVFTDININPQNLTLYQSTPAVKHNKLKNHHAQYQSQ